MDDIEFNDLGLCEYGQGTDPENREPDACPNQATNITEEGYRWCLDHAKSFYECAAILHGGIPLP
jgi:hypothetical protein